MKNKLLQHFEKSNWKPNEEFPSYYLMTLYESGGDFSTYIKQIGYPDLSTFLEDMNELDRRTQLEPIDKTVGALSIARDIMESFDPGPAMTIGFDDATYILTGVQMQKIATAIWLADSELNKKQN